MKPKKIIAREFLYLLATLLLLALVYGCFLCYNVYQENKISKTSKEIALLDKQYKSFQARPLLYSASIDNIQQTLYDFNTTFTAHPDYDEATLFGYFPEFGNDTGKLQAAYDYSATLKSGKYDNLVILNSKFPEFFIFSQSDLDSIKYFSSNIELLQGSEEKFKSNFLSSSDAKSHFYIIGLWAFILIFGLRYLLYTTKWAIVTIKRKRMKEKKKEPKKRNNIPWDIKKDNSLLKTIIISVTVLLSVAMLSYSYYKANQYSLSGSSIIDKYNGTWKSPNFKDNEVREITHKK